MKKFKKLLLFMGVGTLAVVSLTGCTSEDVARQQEISGKLESAQPTPTDISFSLERYNLIRRAYWVNGERDKANALQAPTKLPLGHIVLVSKGTIVMQLDVAGKVSSLNSQLTPISSKYSCGDYSCSWLADTDGSYGDNDEGIFFFTPQGQYVEWKGEYLYSDLVLNSADTIVKS